MEFDLAKVFLMFSLVGHDGRSIYKWLALPIVKTCSLFFALQRHIESQTQPIIPSVIQWKEDTMLTTAFKALSWAEVNSVFWRFQHLSLCQQYADGHSHLTDTWVQWVLALKETMSLTECTLGLQWLKRSGNRNIQHNNKVLLPCVCQPVGYLIPYITRVKVLIQQLWKKQEGWEDSFLPSDLLS